MEINIEMADELYRVLLIESDYLEIPVEETIARAIREYALIHINTIMKYGSESDKIRLANSGIDLKELVDYCCGGR